MIKRWPRCQPVEKDVHWLFCWLSLETCEILDDDLDVSVSTLISLFGGDCKSKFQESEVSLSSLGAK